MAIILEAKTRCSICGHPIETDNAIAFPAFLAAGHRLAMFSDAVFHKDCFAKHPDHQNVETTYARYREIWDSRPNDLKTVAEIELWGKNAFREL